MADLTSAFSVDKIIEFSEEGTSLVGLIAGTNNPMTGLGEAAPIGSCFFRSDGTIYSKVGALDTDWSLIGTAAASTPDIIWVSTGGNDSTGDGSFANPYLTVKKGIIEAALIGSPTTPASVKVMEGVYNEVNPIALSSAYVKVIGNDQTRTIVKPTVVGQPLFVLSSSVAFRGPIMSAMTLQGDATYKATSGGSLVQLDGNGVFLLSNVVMRSGNIGLETGVGTITTSQIAMWGYGASIGNTIGTVTRSTSVLGLQFYMSMSDSIGIQSNDDSEIQLGMFNVQGTPASPSISGTGIQVNDTSKIMSTTGVIQRCTTGLQASGSSESTLTANDFVSNTNDFVQVDATASIRIQGTASKTKQLISDGANVSLNYIDTDSGDYIVGSAAATGTPGKEFRVRDADGRVAIGDNATNENIASGGTGGSRSINLIDTNGNLRVWRFVSGAGVDPAVEIIKGINPVNVDSVGDAPIVSIVAATNTITIDVSGTDYNGPLDSPAGIDRTTLATRAFPVGRTFQVNGTASNDGTYTVVSATYNSGPQTISIVVTDDITVDEGALGEIVFGGGAGRTDGPNPGDPGAAVAAGTGNVWWDFFLQEDDYFVLRRRTGGGGGLDNEKLRVYPDRTEIIGASDYDDGDSNSIAIFQHNANAINNLNFENSSTGNPVLVEAQGTDTNIDVNILPKGTGVITVSGTTNYEANVTNDDDIPNKAYVDAGDVISISTINGQLVPTYIDATRANKVLSVETAQFTYAEDSIGDADWIQIGVASDADTGYIMPMDGTIVGVTGQCENTNGNTKDIDLFINAANNGSIGQFVGAGEQSFNNITLNINVNQGQKLRLQGRTGQGIINDTVVTLRVKWRT